MSLRHNPNAGWNAWETDFEYPLMELINCSSDVGSQDGSAAGMQSTGHFHVERILVEHHRMAVPRDYRIELVVTQVLNETVPVDFGWDT
jgi:hypothetical protein